MTDRETGAAETGYETVYILRPDLSDEGIKKANDRVSELLNRFQGRLESLKDLGTRGLAYRIGKQTRGRYFQLNYRGHGQAVSELERHLKLSEEVLRFLTVRERRHRGGPA